MWGGRIMTVLVLGARLMAGQQILDLLVEVRILCPQPLAITTVRWFFAVYRGMNFAVFCLFLKGLLF